jgi:DNA-binding NarL/FixJ family response regulator
MPRMDGVETLQALRQIDPKVRVILSSGYDEQDVQRRFDGLDLAGFVQKPYRLAVLAETVHKAFEE